MPLHKAIWTLAGAVLIASGAAAPASAAEVLKAGTLAGVEGHASRGTVEIVRDGELLKVVLKSDFVLKDAPDPKLAWGNKGYQRGTIFAKLGKLKGEQEYVIPSGTDLSTYTEFWLWCERYNVGLAVARLNPPAQ